MARARRGMSRKSLSRASGVSERYLAELERGAGNASLLVLRQVAEALSIEAMAASSRIFDPELTEISRETTRPDESTTKWTTAVPTILVRGLILLRSRCARIEPR